MKSKMKWVLCIGMMLCTCLCMSAVICAEWLSFDVTGLEYTKHNDPAGEALTSANVAMNKIVVGDTVYFTGTRNGNDINNATVLNIDKSGALTSWQDAGATNVYSREGVVTNASLYWYMSDAGAFVPNAPGLYRIYAYNSAIGVSPIQYFYVLPNTPADIEAITNLKVNGESATHTQAFHLNRYGNVNLSWSLPQNARNAYVNVRYYDKTAAVWYDVSGFSGIEVSNSANSISIPMAEVTASHGMGYYMLVITSGNGRGTVGAHPVYVVVYNVWNVKFGTLTNGTMDVFVTEPSDNGLVTRVVTDGEKFVVDRPLSVTAKPDAGYYTARIEAEKRTYESASSYTSTRETLCENSDTASKIDYHQGYAGYADSTVDEVVITPYFEKETYRLVFYDQDQTTVLFEKHVTYGDRFPTVDEPSRPNYALAAWKLLSGTNAPATYSPAAVAGDMGRNGDTVSYYATYREGDTLLSLSASVSKASVDVDEAADLIVTASFMNKETGETYARTVVPSAVTANPSAYVSIGTLGSTTKITGRAAGTAKLTVTYTEGDVTKTAETEIVVISGLDLGNVKSHTIASSGSTDLYEPTLAAAQKLMPTVDGIIFENVRTDNGYINGHGVYTPVVQKTPGTFTDTLFFYCKNADGETIFTGSTTVSYTVKDSFSFTVSPAVLHIGAPASLMAVYALDNGYSEQVTASYSVSKEGVIAINGNTAVAVALGDVTVTATYKSFSDSADLSVRTPEVVYLSDGTTKLYTTGSGMTVVLEEYKNYYDYMDEEIIGDITPGADIVIARVYMHDELSFNPVGVALQFDEEKLVPMNYDTRSGDVKYTFGDSGFSADSAVETVRNTDSVYVAEILTDIYGTNYLYGLIGTTGAATKLTAGESVQVMSMLFVKRTEIEEIDASVIDFYNGADPELSKAYKTDWGNSGKTISHISGVASENEVTIADAFTMVYPLPAPEVALTAIEISAEQTELFVGDQTKLSVIAVYSDSTTAPVDAVISADLGDVTDNVYTATTAGTVTLSASYEGMSATLSLTVTQIQAVSMELSCDKEALELGETATFSAVVTYNNGTTKTVTDGLALTATPASSAAISGNTVTALAAGDMVITAAFEGLSESLTITVNEPQVVKVRGDVNCDGSVRMNDLIMLLSHLSSSTPLSEQGMLNADVTEDGKVLMNDLIVLLTYLSTGSWVK